MRTDEDKLVETYTLLRYIAKRNGVEIVEQHDYPLVDRVLLLTRAIMYGHTHVNI